MTKGLKKYKMIDIGRTSTLLSTHNLHCIMYNAYGDMKANKFRCLNIDL